MDANLDIHKVVVNDDGSTSLPGLLVLPSDDGIQVYATAVLLAKVNARPSRGEAPERADRAKLLVDIAAYLEAALASSPEAEAHRLHAAFDTQAGRIL